MIQIQTEYAKTAYAAFVAHATKMRELYSDLAKAACKPVEMPFANTRVGSARRALPGQMDSFDREGVAASLGLRANPESRILSCFPPASGLSPSHGLVTGADCDPAKGHVSLVSYSLAVLARGACSEADLLP